MWNINADGSFICIGSCGESVGAPVNYYEGNGFYTHVTTGDAAGFTKAGRLTYNRDGYITISGDGNEDGDTQGAVLCIADDVCQYVVFRYRTNKDFTLGLYEYVNNKWVNISATSEWTTAVFDMGSATTVGRVAFRFNVDGGDDCAADISHFASFNSQSEARAWAEMLDSMNNTCVLNGHNILFGTEGTIIASCTEYKGSIWGGNYTSKGDSSFLNSCFALQGGIVTDNGAYVTLAGCGTQIQYMDAAANRYVVVVYRKGTATWANGLGVCYYNGETSGSQVAFISWTAGASAGGNQVDNTIALTDGWVVGIADMKCVSNETYSIIAFAPDNGGTGSADIAYYATFASEDEARLFANTIKEIDFIKIAERQACANGHAWGEYVSDGNATCTADGTKTAQCTICGNAIDTLVDEGTKLGHSFTNYISNNDAGCEVPETQTAKCDRCNEVDTIEMVGTILGHDYVYYDGKDATCTEVGWKAYKVCSRCNKSTYEAISNLDHDWVNATPCAATCYSTGLSEGEYCSRCNYGYDALIIAKVDHAWGEYVSDGNATCGVDGTKTAKCTKCDETNTIADEGTAKEHDFEVYRCMFCGIWNLAGLDEVEDGTDVVIGGQVRVINSVWNSSSCNMSVTIYDDFGHSMYLYNLATEVILGDYITVTGKMESCSGNKQIAAGATATIDKHEDYVPTYEKKELSEMGSVADNTYVEVTGTVISIDTAWSSTSGNMYVTISDSNGNTLYIYKLATEVSLCDVITVKGYKTTYNGNAQIGEGATATIGAEKNHNYAAATCTKPTTCICGLTQGEALGHNYENGVCTRCGDVEGVEKTETTVTVNIKDYATENEWGVSAGGTSGGQYTKIVMDENITVTCSEGSNSGKYYSNGWRIYESDSAKLTITAAEGKTIKSVKVTYTKGNSGALSNNGTTVDSDAVVEVDSDSISLDVIHTSGSKKGQAIITAIEVIYF